MRVNKLIFATLALLGCFSLPLPIQARTGAYQRFENGSIYSSDLGTYAVIGRLDVKYREIGATASPFGFPIGETYSTSDRGLCQEFEGGTLCENDFTQYCEQYRLGNISDTFYEERCGTLLQTGRIVLPNITFTSRKAWGALYSPAGSDPETYDYFVRDRGRSLSEVIDTIVIHHTTDSQYQPIIELERKEHDRGFQSMPYHFIIDGSGNIYEGRPLEFLGDHVVDQNYGKIGIVLMGDFEPRWQNFWQPDFPTGLQLDALKSLADDLQDQFGVNSSHILGHRFVTGQTGECPGDNLESNIESIRTYADTH